MSALMGWLRRLGDRVRWDGTTGPPRSANAASSLHLLWDTPAGEWTGAEAVLEVTTAPSVAALYFWALQVSFDERGRAAGGAHLGLQWYPPHPGSAAVNWGGYGVDGRELSGSVGTLPSATGNPNTRDYVWRPHARYLLSVRRHGSAPVAGEWAWRAAVTEIETGTVTAIRDLYAPGSTLLAPMVWSEVFADCDAPSAAVRWSQLTLVDAADVRHAIRAVRVNYQSVVDGGCSRTNCGVRAGGFEQATNTTRLTPAGTRLVLD